MLYNPARRSRQAEGSMDKRTKPKLEQMEILREQALYGPEENREEAHKEYEELREKLLQHEQCETPKSNES
jgi:small-conductance mechanosensitive channel